MEENHHFPIARGGGSVGFEALVQPHLTTAFRVAFLIVHDYHLAQDAVQEALWEAYQSLYRYDERKGTSFRAWFMKIVTHRALNLVRRKKKRRNTQTRLIPTKTHWRVFSKRRKSNRFGERSRR
ncbi:RNA polymerase sigma factor [Brevibacillus laterosporus]